MHTTSHGELWMDWDNTYKFSQYGWRCTTDENDYSVKTLIENWNEEQYDIPENCAAQATSFPGMSLCFSLLWI